MLLSALFIFLGWLVAVGLSVAIGLLLAAGAHAVPAGILVGVLGALTATVFAVIVAVRWSLAVPAVMLERRGPMTSLGRSWRLVRRSSWRVLGITLLVQIIATIANGVIQVPFTILGGTSTFSLSQAHPSLAATIISAIGGMIGTTLTAPLAAGAAVLLYADLRMRREGMDITLQAAAASPGSRAAADGRPGRAGPGPTEPRSRVIVIGPIGRDPAQRLAREELSKAIYHQTSILQSVEHAIVSFLQSIFDGTSQVTPGGWWTVVALAALTVVIGSVVAARLGPLARSARRTAPLLEPGVSPLTARQLRDAAEAGAAAGDYGTAILQRLRAIAAACEERGILVSAAGRTADELATQAGLSFPAMRATSPPRPASSTRYGTAAGPARARATSGCASSTSR